MPGIYVPRRNILHRGAAPIVTAAVTWDLGHTDSAITLDSSTHLIASATTLPDTANRLSHATAGVAANSKVYWEVLANTIPSSPNAVGLGFADSTFTIPQDNFLGSGASTLGWYGSTGAVFLGGSQVATWAQYTSADIPRLSVDTVNSKIWGAVGSGGWNNDILANQNPATNTGGVSITGTPALYPALVFRADTVDAMSVTGQFSSASWSFPAPAGFTHL